MKLFSKRTITAKEVVDLCRDENGNETVTHQMLSMRKTRDEANFPKETNGYYKTIDMLNYLMNENLVKTEIKYVPKSAGSFIIITICGRARTGKDYLAAIFVENPALYRQLFSASGDDYTQCREEIHIADDNENRVVIKTDLSQQYKEKYPDKLSDNFYALALSFNNKIFMLDSECEVFLGELQNLNELCKKAREAKLSLDGTYITIDMRPSAMASRILDNINRDWMQINVYPGESGNVKNGTLSKSDLFMLLNRSENADDAKTIIRIADGIKPYCADAKVITLFRGSEPIDTQEEYEDNEKECIESSMCFSKELDSLKSDEGILKTDLSIVQLKENTMMIPPIKKNASNKDLANKIFTEKLENKISTLLKPTDYISKIKDQISKAGADGLTYVNGLLSNIKIKFGRIGNAVSLANFDRCFSYNYHDLSRYATEGMNEVRKELYDYFNALITAKEEWQRMLAVLMYKYLSSQCRDDAGLGIAWHPFEAKPPVCMRTEEAICAHDVLNVLKTDGENGFAYEKALQGKGIVSKTWNYVSIKYDENEKREAIKRLELIDIVLEKYNGKDYKEAVLVKQIIGAFIYAEYVILTKVLNLKDFEAIDALKGLIEKQRSN